MLEKKSPGFEAGATHGRLRGLRGLRGAEGYANPP